MFSYIEATTELLEQQWNQTIKSHPGDDRWVHWKELYMEYQAQEKSQTFLVLKDGIPIGEGTLLFDPTCEAIGGNDCLADRKRVANVNALRIQKKYEGEGHISRLMQLMEQYARQHGYEALTIGVDAIEARNLGIYLHWGYTEFVMSEVEDEILVLYYRKRLTPRIAELTKIGFGNTADVYACGADHVYKLFHNGYPEACARQEYENMKLVNALGIPAPKVYEFLTIEGRHGMLEERLYGETLMGQLITGKDAESVIYQMVQLQKQMLDCNTTQGVSYKDSLRGFLYGKLDEKNPLYTRIDHLPEGTSVCHGDYHPDNVWKKPDGSYLVIDFMNICHGPRLYDIARSYYLMSQGSLPYGMSEPEKVQLRKMQKAIGKLYLESMQVTEEQIREYVEVIAACRVYEMM